MTMRKNLATILGLALLAAAVPVARAGAAPRAPENVGTVKTYIIKTRSISSASGVVGAVATAGGEVKNVYTQVYPGFSARLTPAQARALEANPRVVSVVPDEAVHATVVQSQPAWGLDRIDQRTTSGDGTYSFDTTVPGSRRTSSTRGSGSPTMSSGVGLPAASTSSTTTLTHPTATDTARTSQAPSAAPPTASRRACTWSVSACSTARGPVRLRASSPGSTGSSSTTAGPRCSA
jgi:hypothetical protein